MRRFRWLSTGPVPAARDLRARGWELLFPGDDDAVTCPALLDDLALAESLHAAPMRSSILLIGVDDSGERAKWLAIGFGDAMGSQAALDEIEQRAMRVRDRLATIPRRRLCGKLELDMPLRDGLVNGRRLGLHPREFALLWRLADTPSRPVSAQELLREVWQVKFRPETNSLAVHVCRLRAKLASAGLAGIITTMADGGYALTPAWPTGETLANQRWTQPGAVSHMLADPAA